MHTNNEDIPGFSTFELDLPEAIAGQITNTLTNMRPASLLDADLNSFPNFTKGIYCLEDHSVPEKQNKLVYVGKADGREGIQQRLKSHQRRIQMRTNLDASKIFFKALQIFVFQPRDVEEFLIMSFQSADTAEWNKNGFGTNDPGRNRDDTVLKSSHYDAVHSIDLHADHHFSIERGASVANSVRRWAQECPWTCRNMTGLKLEENWRRNVECRSPHEFLKELEAHMLEGSRVVAHPGRLYVPQHSREVDIFKETYGSVA